MSSEQLWRHLDGGRVEVLSSNAGWRVYWLPDEGTGGHAVSYGHDDGASRPADFPPRGADPEALLAWGVAYFSRQAPSSPTTESERSV
jgi:hypothetical protein